MKQLIRVVLTLALGMLLALAVPHEAVADTEASYGSRNRDYPISRSGLDFPQFRVGNYSNWSSLFTHHTIAQARDPRQLEIENENGKLDPEIARMIQEHLSRFAVTGFLVIQGDRILFERYQLDRKPDDRFHGWSMSKSVLGLLVGLVIKDGLVRSINDRVSTYVPELAGTLHGESRIKDLLQMSSGAAVLHKPRSEGGDLTDIYSELNGSSADTFALIKSWNRRAEAPGVRFNYNELAPITLVHLVRRVTGESLAAYLERRLWMPMGAASSATWSTDTRGVEFGCIGLSATLRDWGRLGALLADGGRYRGREIIDPEWIRHATTVDHEDRHLAIGRATPHSGYGYLTWIDNIPGRHTFSFRGHHNQVLIASPKDRIVVVQTAVDDNSAGAYRSLYAIVAQLISKTPKPGGS